MSTEELIPSTTPETTPQPTTTDITPQVPKENWIDHEFLFHNEHVKVIGDNTVSISGPGIIKTILRPGHGDYPLPKSLIEIDLIGRVQITNQVFQNSRDITIQQSYLKQKQQEIFDRQLYERRDKHTKDLQQLRTNGGDKAEIAALINEQEKQCKEAIINHEKFVKEETRHELYLQPTKFQLGQQAVVRGLELAVQTMKVGELALITCKCEYAYSDLGIEDYIPDNATIEYEVELLSTDAAAVEIYPGIMKKFIKKGLGWSSPQYNTTCDIFIEGSYAVDNNGNDNDNKNDKQFMTKPFLQRTEFPIQCRIDDVLLPEGIEECLKSMKRGEIALFEVNKNILLGNGFEPKRHSSPLPIPPIPSIKDNDNNNNNSADIIVFYHIELIELHHNVEIWSLKLDERITESERIKEVGNEFFRLGLQNNQINNDIPLSYTMKYQLGYFARAIQRYLACLDLYEHFAEYEQRQCTYDMITRVVSVQLACCNNLAIIYSKIKKYKECDEITTKAINLFMTPIDIYKHQIYDGEAQTIGMEVTTENTTTNDNDKERLLPPNLARLPSGNTDNNQVPDQLDTPTANNINNNDSTTINTNTTSTVEPQLSPLTNDSRDVNDTKPPETPTLHHKKAVLLGKTYPKQTTTNNLYKTLYRRAQALLLLDDPDAANQVLKLCHEMNNEKVPFQSWRDGVAEELKLIENGQNDVQNVPLYKDQPILMYNIIPLKLQDEKENVEKLFPVHFETVTDDMKKEIDKLQVLIDKKLKAVQQRSKQAWAKAFSDE